MQIIDLHQPEAPFTRGSVLLPAIGTDIVLRGYHAYVSTSGAGVQILDIRDPAAPFLVGSAPSGDTRMITLRDDELLDRRRCPPGPASLSGPVL